MNFYSHGMKSLSRNLVFTPYLHRGVLRYAHKFTELASHDSTHASIGASGDTELIFFWAAGEQTLELDIEYLDDKYVYYSYYKKGNKVEEFFGELTEENYRNVFSQVTTSLELLTAHVNKILATNSIV